MKQCQSVRFIGFRIVVKRVHVYKVSANISNYPDHQFRPLPIARKIYMQFLREKRAYVCHDEMNGCQKVYIPLLSGSRREWCK